MNRLLGKWVAAFVVYIVVKEVLAATLTRGAPTMPGSLSASILASAIMVALLAMLASRVTGRGSRRVLTLFVLAFVPQANNFAELLIFPLDLRAHLAPLFVLQTGLLALATALVLDRLTSAGPEAPTLWPSHRKPLSWVARLLACDFAYVVVYVIAGMTVWPFVRPFYEHRVMPTPGAVLSMQVLRGLVFVGLLTWLIHELRVRRSVAALLGGLTLAIFSGAEMIVPNPYLPDFARLPHLVEIGVSDTIYGALVVWVLSGRSPQASRQPVVQPSSS